MWTTDCHCECDCLANIYIREFAIWPQRQQSRSKTQWRGRHNSIFYEIFRGLVFHCIGHRKRPCIRGKSAYFQVFSFGQFPCLLYALCSDQKVSKLVNMLSFWFSSLPSIPHCVMVIMLFVQLSISLNCNLPITLGSLRFYLHGSNKDQNHDGGNHAFFFSHRLLSLNRKLPVD